MYTTRLRKVGGSVMLAVPPALLDTLGLSADKAVTLDVVGGELVIRPARRRYTMAELLAVSDYSQPQSAEDREWVDAAPAGREPL
ncbi:antitoxin [Vineibacter terrae]|uniref:AbrB/MazE/SpoVT family DNA-binding domain-containing protein n=1 Tax=Vineibacter terrae TaxID=2586908 RepID=UPI002E30D5DD|nr:antitoxin [Vineibacter terrae]HEX2886383.1 antitoxin [Vineibacter terrae]